HVRHRGETVHRAGGGHRGNAECGHDQPRSRNHTAEADAFGVRPRWQGRAAQTWRRTRSHRRGSSLKVSYAKVEGRANAFSLHHCKGWPKAATITWLTKRWEI